MRGFKCYFSDMISGIKYQECKGYWCRYGYAEGYEKYLKDAVVISEGSVDSNFLRD